MPGGSSSKPGFAVLVKAKNAIARLRARGKLSRRS